ncbi:MAG: hypothetical protein K8F91_10560, partial [Candidatus Obscuribacterales bacterium]|nr:hypothetical protein [Candidatus Obscuribacterales bacterium]
MISFSCFHPGLNSASAFVIIVAMTIFKNNNQNPSSTNKVTMAKGEERGSVVSTNETISDRKSDQALRPESLKDYVGQSHLKRMLTMSIAAAKERQEALDHVLLY